VNQSIAEADVRRARPGHWLPELKGGTKNVYLAIVDAIAADIQCGRLSTADRLPAQRELARALDVNYATISRAYGEAQRRGLIYSRVGQGSFVCKPRPPQVQRARSASPVDMTMNLPPEPDDPALRERLEDGVRRLASELRDLLRYQEFGGSCEARLAGVQWLSRVGVEAQPERLLVCPGAQGAILAIVNSLAKPGDVALCENLTYPGVRAIAAQLGIRLIGLPSDAEGISSGAFAAACEEYRPKLLYCNPTLQNPTTCTISARRRAELVRLARLHGLTIVEDDAYGVLPLSAPPPFALLAPDITFYVAGFAKCLGAGLRVAYLLAPDARRAARLSVILRATSVMASPITVALATHWVEDGTAEAALRAIRSESIARQRMVARMLAPEHYQAHPEGFHVWLRLPAPWKRAAFTSHVRAHGVHVVPSDAFAVGAEPPEAVRVCLGGEASRSELRELLAVLAATLQASSAQEPSAATA
jgi:DNA-binding transcriptional MocR family regulator